MSFCISGRVWLRVQVAKTTAISNRGFVSHITPPSTTRPLRINSSVATPKYRWSSSNSAKSTNSADPNALPEKPLRLSTGWILLQALSLAAATGALGYWFASQQGENEKFIKPQYANFAAMENVSTMTFTLVCVYLILHIKRTISKLM